MFKIEVFWMFPRLIRFKWPQIKWNLATIFPTFNLCTYIIYIVKSLLVFSLFFYPSPALLLYLDLRVGWMDIRAITIHLNQKRLVNFWGVLFWLLSTNGVSTTWNKKIPGNDNVWCALLVNCCWCVNIFISFLWIILHKVLGKLGRKKKFFAQHDIKKIWKRTKFTLNYYHCQQTRVGLKKLMFIFISSNFRFINWGKFQGK
jgi:hypothetical protein